MIPNSVTSNNIKDGTYCFRKLFNRDVTDVQLTIVGDAITGSMNRLPYEKDSAKGTLKGTKNPAGEFDLMYDYMIEGSRFMLPVIASPTIVSWTSVTSRLNNLVKQ